MILVHKNHCAAGIYYCDADKEGGMKSSNQQAVNKHYDQVYNEVREGLDSETAVPMIPLSMIECWLLGDRYALEQVYRISIKQNDMPVKPEYLWGAKKDPHSNFPKNYFVRLIRDFDKKYYAYEACREDFQKIAECSDITILRKKCPYSYNRFYMDFVNMLKRYNA